MDFSKFSDESFNVKDWVNGVFSAQQDEKQREAYTATLVTKLQRYIQEVNKSLEDTSQQTVAALPRVLRDVETLKQEATFLWQQMQQVKDEIKSVEQRTSHSMQVLVRVDNVRSRVEDACAALKEADNWSNLASAVEDVFRSGDVEAIANQLQSMQASLQVLRNSPDYEDKVMHLEALKNRLESSISPHVVAAFMHHKTEESKRYYTIFTNLDRQTELRNYYLKCHRAQISSKWQEIVSGEVNGAKSTEQDDVAILPEFYELLLSVWHIEMLWCMHVFGKDTSVSIILQLILEAMLSVESGPGIIINNCLTVLASEKLCMLSRLYMATDSFVQNLKQVLSRDDHEEHLETGLLTKLSDAIWHPYIAPFLDYEALETETLLSSLTNIILDAHDVIDLVQLLDGSVKKLFDEATSALHRCGKLTGYLGSCDLLSALEKYFREYCNRFGRQLRTIAASFGFKKGQNFESSDVIDDENWTVFQRCVRIIAICGKILIRFDEFQGSFVSALQSSSYGGSSLLCDDRQSQPNVELRPWDRYNYLNRVDPQRYRLFQELLCSVQDEGGVHLFLDTKNLIADLNQQAHNLTFDVAFTHVKRQLSSVPLLAARPEEGDAIVSQSEMPMFSVSPSEHATHIGQYLMTLPQHLEPFSVFDSAEKTEDRALETALRSGKLPFPPKPGEDELSEAELYSMSDQWLGAIVRATEETYIEAVTQIESLGVDAARQLVADLDYMGNVIDSLGLSVSMQLLKLRRLMSETDDDGFRAAAADAPHRLANAVASMRNVTL